MTMVKSKKRLSPRMGLAILLFLFIISSFTRNFGFIHQVSSIDANQPGQATAEQISTRKGRSLELGQTVVTTGHFRTMAKNLASRSCSQMASVTKGKSIEKHHETCAESNIEERNSKYRSMQSKGTNGKYLESDKKPLKSQEFFVQKFLVDDNGAFNWEPFQEQTFQVNGYGNIAQLLYFIHYENVHTGTTYQANQNTSLSGLVLLEPTKEVARNATTVMYQTKLQTADSRLNITIRTFYLANKKWAAQVFEFKNIGTTSISEIKLDYFANVDVDFVYSASEPYDDNATFDRTLDALIFQDKDTGNQVAITGTRSSIYYSLTSDWRDSMPSATTVPNNLSTPLDGWNEGGHVGWIIENLNPGEQKSMAAILVHGNKTSPLRESMMDAWQFLGRKSFPSWTFKTGDIIAHNAAVFADLNGDGQVEVVFGSRDGSTYAVNGKNGTLSWQVTTTSGGLVVGAAVGDVDGDGKLEVVYRRGNGLTLAVNGEDGSILWSFSGGAADFTALADVDGDGTLEVITGGHDNRVRVLNGEDGSEIWSYLTGGAISPGIVADVDGDGSLEIVIGNHDSASHRIYSLDAQGGTLEWTYDLRGVVGILVGADVDNDSKIEIFAGSSDGKLYSLNGVDGSLRWTYSTGGTTEFAPALGDLDGDGLLEVVFGSYDGKVRVLDARHGTIEWITPLSGGISTGIALADLNGDGFLDVVVGTRNHFLYVLDNQGNVLWYHATLGRISSHPIVGDVDGDMKNEVVFGSDDSYYYAIDVPSAGVRAWWQGYHGSSNFRQSRTLADVDPDGDQLSSYTETLIGTNASRRDTDGDQMPDGWEYQMGLNATDPADATQDADDDGMPNAWEYQMGLNATDPADASLDKDNDGLSNLEEYQLGTNASNMDSDADGMPDGWEIEKGLNATNPSDANEDADGDGLTNLEEYNLGLDPRNPDTDGDGTNDGEEVHNPFLDPKNPSINRNTLIIIMIGVLIIFFMGLSGFVGYQWWRRLKTRKVQLQSFRDEGLKLGFSGKVLDVYVDLRKKRKLPDSVSTKRSDLPESAWVIRTKKGLSLLGAWFLEQHGTDEVTSLRQVAKELGVSVEVVRSEVQHLIDAGKLQGNIYGTVHAAISRDKLLDVLKEASDRFERLVSRTESGYFGEEELLEAYELGQLLEALSEAGRILGISMLEEMASRKRAELHQWIRQNQ